MKNASQNYPRFGTEIEIFSNLAGLSIFVEDDRPQAKFWIETNDFIV